MRLPRFVFFYLTSFLADATTMLVLPLFAIHAIDQFHPSPLALGFMGTANSIGAAIVAYFAGRLSDRTGRRVWVLAGAAAHMSGCLILPHCHNLYLYIAVVTCQISLLGCFWAPLMGWLSEMTAPGHLARSISRWNMTWCAGTITGSFAGGALYDHVSHAAPFYAGAACMALVFMIFALGRPIAPAHGEPPPHLTHPHAVRFTIQAWLTLAGSMFVVNLLVYLFPKVLDLDGEPVIAQHISSLHGIRLSAMFVMFAVMGATARWHFRIWPAHISFALLCCVPIVAAFLHSEPPFALVFFLVGVAMGIAYGLSVYYSMSMPSKGHMGGIHEALMSTGGALGPFYGGILMQSTGSPKLTFWACLAPLLAIWFAGWRLSHKLPPPTASNGKM